MFNSLILIHQYILIAQSNLLKYMNNFFKYLLKIFWKLSEFFQIFCLVLLKFSSSFCPNISFLRYIICENSLSTMTNHFVSIWYFPYYKWVITLSLTTNNDDFHVKQRHLEALVRKANDTLKSFKEILNAAENFVEDGNDLLKQFVNKMNHSIFFDGQQKIELFQKWRKELNEA